VAQVSSNGHGLTKREPVLRLTDVHTYIAGSHILQGVTFDVTEGETTVLLGRNGAGKSTTLRTILGLWQARSGSILLGSRSLIGMPAHAVVRCGLGFVPEDREVFGSLTVEENLLLAVRGGGKGRLDRVYELFPDLRAARSRSARALSGGQQQMLAIGRALVNPNRVLLIDEPTKGLAPVIVQELARTLRELQSEGQTTLLVEQNLSFAQSAGDRYFIVDSGRVVHGGGVSDLATHSEIVQRYVGV